MHPDGFKPDLTNGTLYFAHSGEPIGKVLGAELVENCDDRIDYDQCAELVVKMWSATQSFSCTVEMASYEYMRFAHAVLGIERALAEMCPNRRVVHLVKHARKKRTRKKNYKRMIRICEKEKKDEN